MSQTLCPCQSGAEYTDCCEKYISGSAKPETAEQLMRARYTAYTKAEMDFVEKTHDPKTRKDLNMEANRQWAESATWHGLKVLSTDKGGPEDDIGFVEFVAHYDLPDDGPQEHFELSEFNRRDGQWFFTDSKDPRQQTFVRGDKIGRNDPCNCGSGKKYKKCCGK